MLSIFRTNQVFANVLLLVYATITHLSLFIVPTTWRPSIGGLFSEWVYETIQIPSVGASILSILLVALQGTLLNLICTEYRMDNEINLFPGLFYILLTSISPDFLHLSPVLLGNTFMIIALFQLMETYKKYSCAHNIYNVGLWIGIASLFYFSFSIFLLLGWLGLNTLRAFKLKERIMLLFGFFSPYLLVFTYYYWTDKGNLFIKRQLYDNIGFLDFSASPSLNIYICLGAIALFIVLALFNYRNYSLKKNIRVQKNINILYLYLFISFFTILVQADVGIEHLLIPLIPLGIFKGFSFTKMRPQMADSLHLILLVLVLFWQFYPMFSFG